MHLHVLFCYYAILVPGVHEQDFYLKCVVVHSAINENLAIHIKKRSCRLITCGALHVIGLYALLTSGVGVYRCAKGNNM